MNVTGPLPLEDEEMARRISLLDRRDVERSHIDADKLLIALLRDLGYTLTAAAWEALPKWYA